jgi:hypothetical protein
MVFNMIMFDWQVSSSSYIQTVPSSVLNMLDDNELIDLDRCVLVAFVVEVGKAQL